MNWLTLLFATALAAQAGMSKLEAISMIETGNNDRAVGRAGEVSRYQIKPSVWKRYSASRNYHDHRLSAWVAAQYLEQLEASFLRQAGRPPTDFDRYVLWNGGPSYYQRLGYASHRVHPTIRKRAARFANLRALSIEEQDRRARWIASVNTLAPTQ